MDDGSTVATVIEAPTLQTTDKTKQGAVKKIRQLLQERLAKAEIIQISMPVEPTTNSDSIMKFAGIFEDDEDFKDIIAAIKAERKDNNKT